jgi:hypothetical protein
MVKTNRNGRIQPVAPPPQTPKFSKKFIGQTLLRDHETGS